METTLSDTASSRFMQAPLILRAYIVFAVVASVVAISVCFVPPLKEAVLPYTGWSGLSVYLFTLYFAVSAALTQQRGKIFSVLLLLGMALVFGFMDFSRRAPGAAISPADAANPIAAHSSIRMIFSITLPALWIILLRFPSMKRWRMAA
jgi:hypothetical protein